MSIIVVDNNRICELNKQFLRRDGTTDVIAFPFNEDTDEVWGEIYVCDDQARIQAETYGVSYREELARLVIHGILHLLGYDDTHEQGKNKMTVRENHYLSESLRKKE